ERGLVGDERPPARLGREGVLLAERLHARGVEGVQAVDPDTEIARRALAVRDVAEVLLGHGSMHEESPRVAIGELTGREILRMRAFGSQVPEEAPDAALVADRAPPGADLE